MRCLANIKFNLGQSMVILYRLSKFRKGIMMITNIPQTNSEVICNKKKTDDWNTNIKKVFQLRNLGRSLSQLCLAYGYEETYVLLRFFHRYLLKLGKISLRLPLPL